MSFDKEFKKASALVLEASEKATRATAIEMFGEIIRATPVNTGRLRGNWQTTLRAPASSVLERTDPRGLASTSEVLSNTANYQLGDSLFMTNNLPYAQRIEYGHSQQAPAGMVRVTVRAFNEVLEKQARKNKI